MRHIYPLLGLAIMAAPFVSAVADEPSQQSLASAEIIYQLSEISQIHASYDGNVVTWVRSSVNNEKTGRNNQIWLQRDNAEPYRFTHGDSDHSPRISPDGQSMVFTSGRDSETALYKISLSGGEATSLLKPQQGSISVADWHPDGDKLLLSVRIEPGNHPLEEKEEQSEPQPNVTIIKDAIYKRQGGYLDQARASVWQYDLSTKEMFQISTESDYHHGEAVFSPDGECIAYTSNRSDLAADGEFSQQLITYCGDQESLLTDVNSHASQPQWIDNETLLFVRRDGAYEPPALYTVNTNTGETEPLTGAMEHIPSQLTVSRDAAWFIADDRGSRTLNRVNLDSGDYEAIAGQGYSLNDLFINEHIIAATRENEAQPSELITLAGSGEVLRRVDTPNHKLTERYSFSEYDIFTAENERGDQLDIFYLAPANFDENKSYPVILNIKGGPGGMWGHQWFHENQVMAARGYAVVFVNYRGSTGYGYEFQNQVRLDYGGADFRDNMVAIESALERFNWIDSERVFITGGSHGGFLTNWATTQSKLFRAAVTQRSVSNWISEAGTQAFPPISMVREFGGTLWDNYDYYWDRSPLKYADQVTAPTLIIHSSDDHITPVGQGEEWFYALKANEVPVELAVFSGEGHGLSRVGKPVNMVKRLELILEWFDRWDRQ